MQSRHISRFHLYARTYMRKKAYHRVVQGRLRAFLRAERVYTVHRWWRRSAAAAAFFLQEDVQRLKFMISSLVSLAGATLTHIDQKISTFFKSFI